MSFNENLSVIEAVLFAYGEPMNRKKLASAAGIDTETLDRLAVHLNERYEGSDSAFQILKLEDSYQLCTRREYADYVRKAVSADRDVPISQAAMETLALIAYNQPVTKGFIESVRGTDSSSLVKKLAEKGLVCEAGRLEIPGRPVAYKTTELFLRSFGLSSLDELPPLEDGSSKETFFLQEEKSL